MCLECKRLQSTTALGIGTKPGLWTLDWTVDWTGLWTGLDCGLDYGLDFGLDSVPILPFKEVHTP